MEDDRAAGDPAPLAPRRTAAWVGGRPDWARLVLDVTDAAVAVVDAHGVVVECNAAADALLAGPDRTLEGTSVDALVPVGTDDHARLRASFAAAPTTRPLHANEPMHVRSLDGRDLHLRIGLLPTSLAGGPGTVVVLADATSSVERDRAMRLAIESQDALLERLRELEERRQRMITALSHEVRTPLSVLVGVAEFLATRGDGLHPARRDALLRSMERQGDRLAKLLEDAQVLRLSPEQVDAATSSVRLDRVVHDRVVAWRRRLPGTTIELEAEAAEAWIEPDAVGRIVDELLDNAVRHGDAPIRVSVTATAGSSVLEVRDGGPGVPEALRREIFLPFGRGGRVDEASPGLGLGLTVSRVLAEAAGGTLDHAADGACFRLLLPAQGPGQPPAEPPVAD